MTRRAAEVPPPRVERDEPLDGRGAESGAATALAAERANFAHQVAGFRRTLDREFGWAPRSARWLAPTLAAGAGMAVAFWLRRTVRRLREDEAERYAAGRPFGRPRRRR